MDVVTRGQSTTIFYVFGKVTTEEPIEQLGDPSASLLLTRERAVLCNTDIVIDK